MALKTPGEIARRFSVCAMLGTAVFATAWPNLVRAKPVIPTISETQNHTYARAVEPYTSGHVHFSCKITHMDLTGRRFGALTVLKRGPGLYAMKRPSWICRCDCGNKKIVNQSSLLGWPGYRGTTTCGRNCPFYKGARQK